MNYLEVKGQREFLCNIPYDSDLLLSLKELAKTLKIETGIFTFIGALKTACLFYYAQNEKKFEKNVFEGPFEIVSGMGNIATLEGDIVVHAHLVIADRKGNCHGGHLTEGSKVFACEVYLRELSPPIIRKYDPLTGLNLLVL
ncbi:MAG: DNA-binding protein [Candidatus Methanomethyliaceae archaeon]